MPADWTDEQIKKNESLNPVMVEYYRVLGYLPEALINYFGRLGWSLDDKTEIMSLETMIANFGFDRVNDSPASFDPQKLHWVAGEYMKTGGWSARSTASSRSCSVPVCSATPSIATRSPRS